MQPICPYCREKPIGKRKGAKTCGSATCRKTKQRATPERCFDEITRYLDMLESLTTDSRATVAQKARQVLTELVDYVDILKQDVGDVVA